MSLYSNQWSYAINESKVTLKTRITELVNENSTNKATFPSNMSSTNVSNKPRNEITIALKFLHEASFNISYQFDCNTNW